ncbi:type II toxin-antitoxin system death-on-curing family toxin [Chromatiaceae bacterium AAb-1]|nr:type II toxin-antitoxin system death-on-curing family toxin [Chromatiaceae bacterium AAb-1]
MAEALIYRVQNRKHYEGVTDIFELAATYWVTIACGHIFNDDNKRTAFFVTKATIIVSRFLLPHHNIIRPISHVKKFRLV